MLRLEGCLFSCSLVLFFFRVPLLVSFLDLFSSKFPCNDSWMRHTTPIHISFLNFLVHTTVLWDAVSNLVTTGTPQSFKTPIRALRRVNTDGLLRMCVLNIGPKAHGF